MKKNLSTVAVALLIIGITGCDNKVQPADKPSIKPNEISLKEVERIAEHRWRQYPERYSVRIDGLPIKNGKEIRGPSNIHPDCYQYKFELEALNSFSDQWGKYVMAYVDVCGAEIKIGRPITIDDIARDIYGK